MSSDISMILQILQTHGGAIVAPGSPQKVLSSSGHTAGDTEMFPPPPPDTDLLIQVKYRGNHRQIQTSLYR